MDISIYSKEECEKIANESSLRYVNDSLPGISRKPTEHGFEYFDKKGFRIEDNNEIKRIHSLAIPPAYHDVWICPYKNGHIQATARDNKNRKQYRYHPLWNIIRGQNKFDSMLAFGKALPFIRKHIDEVINQKPFLDKQQIMCAIIYLLDHHSVRIGNAIYAKENHSYGLTTLRKKHVKLHAKHAELHFVGKSDIPWHIVINHKKIINVLKKCVEIPGYDLFKYQDDEHNFNVITSQDINNYLKELTNEPFTAKNFRTWVACRESLWRLVNECYLSNMPTNEGYKRIIKDVAAILGHTVNVCQKNYIYPEILNWWQEEKLHQWAIKHRIKIKRLDPDALLLYWWKYQGSVNNH